MRTRPRKLAAALLAAFLTFGFVPLLTAAPRHESGIPERFVNEPGIPERLVRVIKKFQKFFRTINLSDQLSPPKP